MLNLPPGDFNTLLRNNDYSFVDKILHFEGPSVLLDST